MLERSKPGEVPTFHEREVLATSDKRRVSDSMGQWALLAQRVGLTAVLAIMDEFEGEKILIPGRRAFFDALWRPTRDDLARRMRAEGKPASEIADALGISRQHARTIAATPGADLDDLDVVKGAT